MSGSRVKESPSLIEPCRKSYCNPRILVCFGVPLLPPSAILLGIALGSNTDFGLFHIVGLILTFISITCIVLAIGMCSWQRHGRQIRLKVKQLDVERQEIAKKGQQDKVPESNGANGAGSKGRHVWKQSSVNINEKKHGMKKSRKDKTKRRPKATKLPPVKEEDRIRGEDVPRKTHSRSKSDGKTKYPSCREKPPAYTMFHLQVDYDFGQLFGPRRHLRRKKVLLEQDRFVDYDSDSSSQAGPVMRVHRRSKSLSREQFEASLASSNHPAEPIKENNPNFREKLLRHMGLSTGEGDTNDVFPWSIEQSRRRSKSMSDCGDSDKESQTTYSEFSFDIDTPREDHPVRYNK